MNPCTGVLDQFVISSIIQHLWFSGKYFFYRKIKLLPTFTGFYAAAAAERSRQAPTHAPCPKPLSDMRLKVPDAVTHCAR